MRMTRRTFLATSAAVAASSIAFAQQQPRGDKASIAITLDLEMARNFPTWETTHWDYEKGNLNEETKTYAVEAARRGESRGGSPFLFSLGRKQEKKEEGWL